MKTIISFDCETNGKIPGKHSMIQLGAVAFNMRGQELSHFVKNISPLPNSTTNIEVMKWWKTQPEETWLLTQKNPVEARKAMRLFMDWMAQFQKPLLAAAPVIMDGYWVRWYLEEFCPIVDDSFYNRALDVRSVVWALTGKFHGEWKDWVSAITGQTFVNPHPHYALADARQQGQYLFSLLNWARRKGIRINIDN